jgi:serpin B
MYSSLNLVASTTSSLSLGSKELAKANNEFAFKLFGQLDDPKEKVTLFSPLSISSAMVMVASGAAGETREEVLELLSISNKGLLGKSFGEYLKSMSYKEPQLEIANALVLQEPEGVLESYKSLLKDEYDAEVFPGNLSEINAWCNKKTYGKIPKILEDLSPDSVCVILNAVYFKGDWVNPFDESMTMDSHFKLLDNETIEIPTMSQTSSFSVFGNDEYKSILLPYKGDKVSMVVVLPNEGTSLDDLKQNFSSDDFADLWKNLSNTPPQKVWLLLPKFKIKSYYSLIPSFKKMGLIAPFDGGDFSGISKESLGIQQIVHKAIVEVDETGTVAAAVTAVAMARGAVSQPPPAFKVDRPFMFFLVDNQSGAILFIARVNDPRE